MSESSLRTPAETAVEQCLNLQPDESCAIVTDDECEVVGEALYAVATEITDDTVLLRYPQGTQHGEEPPESVSSAIRHADVVFAPTAKSLSHTNARMEATEAGARMATLPGITPEVFRVGLDADYDHIREESSRILDRIDDVEEIRVTTPQGTDVTFYPGDREWLADTGIIHDAGQFANLPTGEVFVSPERADGRVVVDGAMAPHGRLEDGQTVEFTIENGLVTDVGDEQLREELKRAAEQVGDAAYNVAELGVGTNVGVTDLVGSVLLDEKAGGTVHIAIGDDHAIGGDVEAPIHLDGILLEVTVYVDGEKIRLPTDNE